MDLGWALLVPAYLLGTFPTAILVGWGMGRRVNGAGIVRALESSGGRALAYDLGHRRQPAAPVRSPKGSLSSSFFRICTMGDIPWNRLEELETALAESIEAARA